MKESSFMENDFYIENGILKAYKGRDELVVVPENVHTIGEGALKGCVSIKKVVLPFGLSRILSGAFKGCRRLREIEIPAGVVYIGDYAFHRCHSLESITLPPSVKELGDCVFLYCDSLTEVRIPGVEYLGNQVFVNDVQLKKLEISPGLREDCLCDVFTGCSRISEISFLDGQKFVFPNAVEVIAGELEVPLLVHAIAVDILRMMELEGRCLVKFLTNLKHVEIPEGIERIGKSSFFDKRGIISVKFPSTLKEIESRAFRNCISLEAVVFGQEQAVIHEDAFKNCSSLKEVCVLGGGSYGMEGISGVFGEEIPALVRTIQKQVLGNFRLSGSVLLKYLGNESRVVVPEGVSHIAEEAFAGNETVDRVILPQSVEEIGAGAFRNCLTLQVVNFPSQLKYIGTGAFENCVKLLRALLPDKLERVEDQVFKRCRRLKELSLGEGVRAIGEQAFYGCTSLSEVHFSDHLVFVGGMAFYRCRSLREVQLPKGIETVGNLAFAQSGVEKVRMEGNARGYGTDIFSRCLSLSTIAIGKDVSHIPDKLAYGCTALKQVILPDTLESVGRNVWEHTPFLSNWLKKQSEDQDGGKDVIFWDGRHLKGDVSLPSNTRIVAGGAFYGNHALTALYFPGHVTWIGGAVLKGCTKLRHVVWPMDVTTAEPEVFSGCASLESVVLNSDSQKIPEGLEHSFAAAVPWSIIKDRAFYNCRKLSGIQWKDIRMIGKEAFFGCTSLMPGKMASLKEVGELAFEGVEGIGEVPEVWGLRAVGSIIISGRQCEGEIYVPEGITAIAPFAFLGNRRITRLVFPETLSSIGEGAFRGCSGLMDISFPAASCVIGARAFEKCTRLSKVCLYAGYAGTGAFAYCLSLEKAEVRGISVLECRLFEGCENLRECICEQVLVIREDCFCGCKNLEKFDFRLIEEIGSYAFSDCDGLREIALGEHALLRPHAFEDCGCLERIVLLGSQEGPRLCEYALSGCTALRQVVRQGQLWELHTYRDILSERLPKAVRLIFHSALSCFEVDREESLCGYRGFGRIIIIPEGIKRIEGEVFQDRLMLEQVHIPDSVEYIGPRAFHKTAWMEKQREKSPMVEVNHMLLDGSSCTGEVVVPEDIRLVCGWAFAGGLGIERIRFLSDRVKVEAYAFRNCIYLKELVLGDGSSFVFEGIADRKKELPALAEQAVRDKLNCFKTDEKDVLVECTGNISRLLVADGITAIGENVFREGNLLTEIVLPRTVSSIGKNAFASCKWLRRVYGAQGVKAIGSRAFSGCKSLEEIELSEKLAKLGARAFENCTSLKEILLPEGMEEIPDRAFFRCHSLQRVHFPSTLRRIGKEAFAFCRNLEIPVVPDGVLVEERAFVGAGERTGYYGTYNQ